MLLLCEVEAHGKAVYNCGMSGIVTPENPDYAVSFCHYRTPVRFVFSEQLDLSLRLLASGDLFQSNAQLPNGNAGYTVARCLRVCA